VQSRALKYFAPFPVSNQRFSVDAQNRIFAGFWLFSEWLRPATLALPRYPPLRLRVLQAINSGSGIVHTALVPGT
jgi:hypothetical protein